MQAGTWQIKISRVHNFEVINPIKIIIKLLQPDKHPAGS